jgi:LuxR family transcriptional regulator, maltose regulon positive regulatory protein
MTSPLIGTKVGPPVQRGGVLARPRLTRMLAANQAPVTLIVAPAGFGKTTLLAEYQGVSDRPFAWLSLDHADNDPPLFWRYVVAAIRELEPEFAQDLDRSMNSLGGLAFESVVARILNELADVDPPLTIVIDDYHVIHDTTCHTTLGLFIERMPASVRLVLSTRSDPALSLGRLRASGALLDLRAADLAFNVDETTELFANVLEMDLPRESIVTLHGRTEGWPAGLYLAYLSLRGAQDPADVVAHFGGSNRYVADYFGQVILDAQDADHRRFLMETCILERLCGPLCDAVTGRAGSAKVLAELEQTNQFLIPLDDHRDWFRYHNLFADLLKDDLQRTAPDRVAALHRRAGQWWAAEGRPTAAISHLVRAGDFDTAAGIVSANWLAYFRTGRVVTLKRWLDAFPHEYAQSDARLCLVRAWILGFAAQSEASLQALASARAAGWEGELPDGTGTLEESITLVRGMFPFDVRVMLAAAGSAYRRTRQRGSFWQLMIATQYAAALIFAGRPSEARGPLEHALSLNADIELGFFACNARVLLAEVALAEGDTREAERLVSETFEIAQAHGFMDLPWAGAYYMVLGLVSESKGDLEQAENHLVRAVELMRGRWWPLRMADALISLAHVSKALGRADETRAALEEARELLALVGNSGALQARLDALTRRPVRRRRSATRDDLTQQESVILALLVEGLTKRQAAEKLYLSYNTVHSHTKSIYRKLGCSSRDELAVAARSLGSVRDLAT